MKKVIFRNITLVSAIFIVTFSIMLITNYFQVRQSSPLQTEIIESLKELNIQNSGNTELQAQIRQLDLMARKAYFVSMDHLITGVYILIGMLLVFIVSIRLYFSNYKDIPEKELDPIDEWVIKTQARKYVGFTATGMAAIALLFVVLSTPFLKDNTDKPKEEPLQASLVAQETTTAEPQQEAVVETIDQSEPEEETIETPEPAVVETEEPTISEKPEVKEDVKQETVPEKVEEVVSEPAKEEPKAVVAPVNTSNFNAFRGNNSNGLSDAKNVPTKWDLVAGTNIAWKTAIPLKGHNSPVVNGDKVFFTGADQDNRILFCYSLNDGKSLWQLKAENIPGSPAAAPKTTDDTGLAAPTVATNGKQVCAIFGTGDLICADMNGNKLWAKNIGVPDNHYGYASSLLTYNNLLIIQYDNSNESKVIALDMARGDEKWSTARQEKITWSSPVLAKVGAKEQLVLMGNPAMAAYDPDNGKQLWREEFLSGEVGASACSVNGIIYGASEYASLTAINGADGSVLWNASDYLPEVASPVATASNVYVATSYGIVVSYDAKTGELKKEQEFDGEFYSSPIIAEGKIFLFSTDGIMHIFSADDEFNLLDSFETGEKVFATPAFINDKIVVRTEESIYCVTTK
ncbi:outer membrane protein assembly factor BamB family protein [Carboxylicivirga linearis]|uniref:PQQ-binding-like beta-propeller repeat protein n=1 Tax=Carboxylicivirga linearis TaxID=1628157 RepID=A0ABS5JW78_9BACT|nr:PQQ-binding-like beta-propeller repeat protein [Carboxylicivirga linearis]MBS2099160.1 PQQ-binding-like beta-propeller repeat protein [Carboxylicivirga linearis]